MPDETSLLLPVLSEIRDLIRLIAEPAIAERDRKRRAELKKIVGHSGQKPKAVALMNGARTQKDIHTQVGITQGNLSTLVSRLAEVGLLESDLKRPKLAISLPSTFFDEDSRDEG